MFEKTPFYTHCDHEDETRTLYSLHMHANDSKYIKEVWADNLEEEMEYLRDLVEEFPYLAMVSMPLHFLSLYTLCSTESI